MKDYDSYIRWAVRRIFLVMETFRIEALQSGAARGRATEALTAAVPPRPRNNSADEPFIAPIPSVLAQITSVRKDATLSKRQEAAVAPPVKIQVPSIFKTMVPLGCRTNAHRSSII